MGLFSANKKSSTVSNVSTSTDNLAVEEGVAVNTDGAENVNVTNTATDHEAVEEAFGFAAEVGGNQRELSELAFAVAGSAQASADALSREAVRAANDASARAQESFERADTPMAQEAASDMLRAVMILGAIGAAIIIVPLIVKD